MNLHRQRSGRSPLLVLTVVLGWTMAACGSSPATPVPSLALASRPPASASVAPNPSPTPTAVPPSPSPTPSGELVAADLSGVLVAPELAHRLPLAVMIDDSRAARPQSGFNAAALVYQSLADGYESRYMLVFQDGDTGNIGPVRSARFFLVQWAQEVKAALAHYGGDRRTRSYIRNHPRQFTDVDGMTNGNAAYHRIKSRKAPHNAYTSTKDLRRVALKRGGDKTMDADLHRRPFRDPVAEAERGAKQSIRVPYRTNIITYKYDRASNRYLRSINGKAHIDPADDQRVAPTNVVVLFQKFRIDTKIEPHHSRPDIKTRGSGKAWFFTEGHLVKGTWKKGSDTGPTRFVGPDGKEFPLVRGQTFIQVVPPKTKITVKD